MCGRLLRRNKNVENMLKISTAVSTWANFKWFSGRIDFTSRLCEDKRRLKRRGFRERKRKAIKAIVIYFVTNWRRPPPPVRVVQRNSQFNNRRNLWALIHLAKPPPLRREKAALRWERIARASKSTELFTPVKIAFVPLQRPLSRDHPTPSLSLRHLGWDGGKSVNAPAEGFTPHALLFCGDCIWEGFGECLKIWKK